MMEGSGMDGGKNPGILFADLDPVENHFLKHCEIVVQHFFDFSENT